MKALAALFSALVLGCLLAAPNASGTRPDRFFLPAEDFVISGSCGFDVGVHTLQNNEYMTVFENGRSLVTGVLKERLTNLSDPSKSIDVNVSGPGTFTPTPDGGFVLRAEGRWLFWFAAGDLGAGSPAILVLTSGLTIASVDGSGNISFAPSRNTRDLCAALA